MRSSSLQHGSRYTFLIIAGPRLRESVMIRIRRGFNEARAESFYKQGRGQGEHASYEPWLRTHEVTSTTGRKSKIFGEKSQRLHQLFTDLECDAVTLIDWSARVSDIRERYPLDQGLVRKIADDLGVKLPVDKASGTSLVFCTDLFISVGADRPIARSIRYSSDLAKKAVINLLEVERRYWAHLRHDWRIVTERDIDDTHLHNVNFGRSHVDLSRATEICGRPVAELAGELLSDIVNSPHLELKEICARLDSDWGIPGQALYVLRHLVGIRVISCGPTTKLATSLLANELTINSRLK